MSLGEWVRQHRDTINAAAVRQGAPRPRNDDERADWVLNDEPLYLAARADGVPI